MMKKHIAGAFVLITFFIFSTESFAQTNFKPGHVVLKQQDTIRGEIDYRGAVRNSRKITLITGDGAEKIYSPAELLMFWVEGVTYKPFEIPTKDAFGNDIEKAYFFKVLEAGKVDFVFLRDEQNQDRYFIASRDEGLKELTNSYTTTIINGQSKRKYNRKYLSVLRIHLTGCDEFNNLDLNISFSEKAMLKAIREYNNCFRTEKTSLVSKEKKIQLRPEFYVGAASSTLDAENVLGQELLFRPVSGIVSPLFSAVLKISSAKLNDKLSINLGVDYLKKGAECEETRRLDLRYVDIRTYLAYTWPKGRFRPMASGGAVFGRRINSVEQAVTFVRNGERKRYHTEVDPKGEMGFGAEIGADYYAFGASSHSINLRFGFTRTRLSFIEWNDRYNHETFYAKVGFAF